MLEIWKNIPFRRNICLVQTTRNSHWTVSLVLIVSSNQHNHPHPSWWSSTVVDGHGPTRCRHSISRGSLAVSPNEHHEQCNDNGSYPRRYHVSKTNDWLGRFVRGSTAAEGVKSYSGGWETGEKGKKANKLPSLQSSGMCVKLWPDWCSWVCVWGCQQMADLRDRKWVGNGPAARQIYRNICFWGMTSF